MKIKCNYCGGFFDDTKTHCPNCGSINEGVVRTTSDQPQTIEQLKQWYKDRGLPPAETTRFFIGINYKQPRAFGIYKDEQTGNFVVYKNKDSGQRAVRYEGTDEAYAVNELYMRLKQEIIQQKMHQVKKAQGSTNGQNPASSQKEESIGRICLNGIGSILLRAGLWIVGVFALVMVVGTISIFVEPKVGYYSYQDKLYYKHSLSYDDKYWYTYEAGEWSKPLANEEMPGVFEKKKTCKPYYLSKKWKSSIPCTDFEESVWYQDLEHGIEGETGYYAYDNKAYYHDKGSFEKWYKYDGQWQLLAFEDVPYELQHSSLSEKYFNTNHYLHIADETDFTQTVYYRDIEAGKYIKKGYFGYDDEVYYHLQDDYEEGWYYFDNDDWYAIDQSDLPEDLKHPSLVDDFYFTPTWDSSTQFTDFEDTALYEENKPKTSSDKENDDNDYDWGGDDTWDTDTTDWDTDW